MKKKICIVTGATSGIGLETARAIACKNYCVILACRNCTKAEKVRREIANQSGNNDVYSIPLDLSSFELIENFAKTFSEKFDNLDVLINNAGTFCDRRHKTKDGFELTMGVNYVGAFYLTQLLLPIIKTTPHARIINVSSIVGLNCSLKNNSWDFYTVPHGFKAYNASKLAQILYTIALAEELKEYGVMVNSMHPGIIGTNIWTGEGLIHKISKPIMKLIFPPPKKGAETIIYLALSDEVINTSGKMFAGCKIVEYKKSSLNTHLKDQLITITQDAINEVKECKKHIAK